MYQLINILDASEASPNPIRFQPCFCPELPALPLDTRAFSGMAQGLRNAK
jgi:hypothetical protein